MPLTTMALLIRLRRHVAYSWPLLLIVLLIFSICSLLEYSNEKNEAGNFLSGPNSRRSVDVIPFSPLHHLRKGFQETISLQDEDFQQDVYMMRNKAVQRVCRNGNFQFAHKLSLLSLPRESLRLWKKSGLDMVYCIGARYSPILENVLKLMFKVKSHNVQVHLDDYDDSAENTVNHTTHKYMKILFTKNPYRELFEYYIDNYLVPNPAHEVPSNSTARVCYNDLSFANFFRFIILKNRHRSYAGVSRHCDVCGFQYDFIMKEETLPTDLMHVKNIHYLHGNTTFEMTAEEYDIVRIEHYVRTALTRKEHVDCVGLSGLLRRLWRQLQIYGFIHTGIAFSLDENTLSDMNYDWLMDTVLEAYDITRLRSRPRPEYVQRSRSNSDSITELNSRSGRSEPWRRSRSNLEASMAQAYHELTLKELDVIRNMYLTDFYLFGYKDRPSLLYFKQGPKSDFDYFDVVKQT